MSPDDYPALYAQSREGAPFSNSDEGYGWMDANCTTCTHEKPSRSGDEANGCPLILLALVGRRPAQWIDGPRNEHGGYSIAGQYRCVEYRHEDDGPADPQPIPDPPGQLVLVERGPWEGVRMYAGLADPLPQVLDAHHVTDGEVAR